MGDERRKYQRLLDEAMQCINRARAINDRYSDPEKLTGEEKRQRKALLEEAARLRDLADDQKREDELTDWAASPGDPHPALKAQAMAGARAAGSDGASLAQENSPAFAESQRKFHEKAFANYLRYGKDDLTGEQKAAIVEDSTGQIIVPHDLAGPIFLQLPRLGVLRNLCFVRPTTSNLVDVRAITSATAGWGKIELGTNATAFDAGLAATGPNTITVQNLNALVLIGVDELADTDANLVQLVQQIVGEQFGQMEDDAFANGNGTSKPFGLAIRATVGGAIPASQGVTAAGPSTVTGDDLKKMQFAILARFANNGAYLASDDATQAIALLKDSTSNYLWQPSNQEGQPDRLFGKAFYRVSGLPSMATGAGASDPAVLFGDLKAGYMIADRQQITVQRLDERYADAGEVGFLFRQRVGGDVYRPAAFAKYLL